MSHPVPQTGPKLAASRFAQRLLAARPELAAELADPQPFTRAEMLNALEGRADDELERELRRLRNRVLLRVMARDLSGRAGLEEVCATMTDLAEVAIETVLGDHDLMVVGMGKLGGRELNVSSDVDLVFLYRASAEAQERYERAGRRLIRFLSSLSGRVRVPRRHGCGYGDSGPLACNSRRSSSISSQGREWERYAWIKARPLTGPGGEGASRELDAIVRPFVFRKYLDYGTLGALRALHAEVRRDVERRELSEHVKLGPGGIREIEFIVQALQLVRPRRRAPGKANSPPEILSGRILPSSSAGLAEPTSSCLRHRLKYLDDARRPAARRRGPRRVAACAGYTSQARSTLVAGASATRCRGISHIFAEPEARQAVARRSRLAARAGGAAAFENRAAVDRLVRRSRASQATPTRGLLLPASAVGRSRRCACLALPGTPSAGARGAHDRLLELGRRLHHAPRLDRLLDDRLLRASDRVSFSEACAASSPPPEDADRANILREMPGAGVPPAQQDLAGLLTVKLPMPLARRPPSASVSANKARPPQPARPARFAVIDCKLAARGYASGLNIIFLCQDDDERAGCTRASPSASHLAHHRIVRILFETDLELGRAAPRAARVVDRGFQRCKNNHTNCRAPSAYSRAYSPENTRVGRFEAIRQQFYPARIRAMKAEILQCKRQAMRRTPTGRALRRQRDGNMIDIEFTDAVLRHRVLSDFPSSTGI
jgi:glutamate-ammonia-ligase adenylyltransferase